MTVAVADFAAKPIRTRGERPKIALLDGAAIAVPLPTIECLVSEIGLVAGGGAPHMVAGYGFSGKTLALQSLALSLAAARPVWGAYRCSTQRRVLHVDMEQGDRLTRRRYQRLAAAMGVDLATLGETLAVALMPAISLTRAHFESWRELMMGRELMFVDSLRAATQGMEENSSDIRSCLDMLGELSEATQCRPLVIHHSRKPTKDDMGGRYLIRGSSALFDGCDAIYMFSAPKGEPVSVEQVKARTQGDSVPDFALSIADVDLEGDPRGGLRVQVHGHELVDERRQAKAPAECDPQARRDAQRIRDAIAASPGIGSQALRGKTRLSGDRIAAALDALGSAIDVRTEANGRTRMRCHYLRGTQ